MIHEILSIGPRVTALPVVHGSGDFAWEVRRLMLKHDFDALAVPLPPSFAGLVIRDVVDLPVPTICVQTASVPGAVSHLESDSQDFEDFEDFDSRLEQSLRNSSYVPIDPCQPVIAAIRTALGDHLPIHFVDMETVHFEAYGNLMPDPYALKKLSIQRYAAAVLPSLQRPDSTQWQNRVNTMAMNLRELSIDYERILFVCGILEWPWIRQAFYDRRVAKPVGEGVEPVESYLLDSSSLYFMMGELPFITGLYEQARSELEDDANLSIDGVKDLLIASRESYQIEYKSRARKITTKLLSQMLRYIRNLSLIDGRFTPQLVDIVTAAKQIAGDGYALHVLNNAREYRYENWQCDFPIARLSINRMRIPQGGEGQRGEIVEAVNRLPGPPLVWRQIELSPRPERKQQKDWQQRWNPYGQCSWPPEDQLIENFRQTVFDRARELMGADLVQTEKFTTSIRDGIDMRETVRHWYDNEIHVKVLPPTRGSLDAAVMLFDSPADPRDYPWRTTWFAEHQNESTLAFFATDFLEQPVGPGICLANYGGAMFLFPPIPIRDIWNDPRLDFASTLEERLLAAACLHSRSKHIALVSSAPPGPAWRQLAKGFKKSWVHLPLGRFSDSSVQQLRMVHVLNGQQIRSYAAEFIRRV